MVSGNKRIIILGGGVVGSALAEHLLRDGHTLAMIEADARRCEELSEKYDMQVFQASGASPQALHDAGIVGTDLLVAVTPLDDVNLLACAIAAQHNVPQRIARLRNREYFRSNPLFDIERLGVTSVINPEKAMAGHIRQLVATPHAAESADFEEGRVLLRGYRVRETMELAGKTLRELRAAIAPTVVLFAAIVRGGVGIIPDGDTRIQADDIVYTLFPRESLDRFLKLVGQSQKHGRRIVITGDSFTLVEMCGAMQQTGHHITVVIADRDLADQIAGSFGHLEVIHGDCTDVDLLRSINIDAASFFIAVSDQPDYNMLSGLLAKSEGAHEVIVTSTDTRHERLFRSIGLDHVVNPLLSVAREILDTVSPGQIGAVVKLSDVDIDALRFGVEADSEIAGQPIKQIARKLKKGTIIGVIIRRHSMILPDGETVVEAGDHLIVISRHQNLDAITRLFRPRGFFRRR